MQLKRKNIYLLSLGIPVFGIVCIALYASTAGVFGHIVHAFGLFVLTAGATFLLGALLGFMFAIPKLSDARTEEGKQVYQANTNLEQISDWLTKILLGVGLTQMDKISFKVHSISESMAKEMTLIGHEAMFTSALILFYTICGFLNGYLVTRIVLPRVFAASDNTQQSNLIENSTNNRLTEDNQESEMG
ncbi:MAG: hypothetical protein QE487_12280 [Fluviicola sp.]|nr:hypothetical protein [Fluviicola sp.]